MLNIRYETATDYDAINDVIEKAFTPAFGSAEGEVKVVDLLRNDDDLNLFLSLVAEEGSQVVGHILFSPVSIDSAASLNAATLGPIAVLPECQKQGIGSALIEKGFALLREKNIDAVFLTGNAEYYARFGFKPIGETKLKTVFDTPVDMYLELTDKCLDGVEGVVVYPKQWDIFLEG